jgi:glucokinase
MERSMELVADIGGTKTLLGVVRDGGPQLIRRFDNDTAPAFHVLVENYLSDLPAAQRERIGAACFAVAAPITGSPVRLTNRMNWQIDRAQLSALLGGAEVLLVNDFAAAAKGLGGLHSEDLATLQPGTAVAHGLRLCLGPGTGFGVAALDAETVLVSEGGHIGFAPIDGQQADLWRFLGGEHRRVTVERLCSGPGLLAIYRYCLIRSGHALPQDLDASEVLRRAREAHEADATLAVRLLVRILGAVAGDLALTFLARGGVYLAGGIAPRLLPELTGDTFLESFNDKAEHAALVRGMPVHVVLRQDLPLLGAARFAMELS